ncbi:MAG: diacylglycerol kinase family protein [Bacteroidia bacterium]|nr:diacylglycerol kinase family protein [Bacteroidia bacterium]
MKHIFMVNTVAGKHSCLDEVKEAVSHDKNFSDYEIYTPESASDNTDFIKKYLEEHPEEETRFYACGGDGTANKVASGVVGHPNASMTILAHGSGNDYIKYYADLETFQNVNKVLHGEEHKVDIMKANDRYALNATHFGLDAVVAKAMNKIRRHTIFGGKMCYPFAVVWGFLTGMRTKCTVYADGEKLNDGKICLCTVANGKYVGGSYKCAPKSKNDDGLLEVCLVKPLSRFRFPFLIKTYTEGSHLDNPRFQNLIVYRRAKQVIIEGGKNFCVSLDGEIMEAQRIVVDNIQQAIRFVAPTV